MAKIVGPGSLIADITGFAQHLPVHGETVCGSRLKMGPGGKGSNQMTAASRAGSDVKIIGRMGDDALGRMIRDFYKSEGMCEDYITIEKDGETGSALIEVDEVTGQNRIIVILGSNANVFAPDIINAEKEFKEADAVLMQFETSYESVKQATAFGKKYNKPVIINPAPYQPFPLDVFDGVDYVTPNETEAEQYTGVKVDTVEDCRKAAEKFFAMGVKNVIITLGVRGAYFNDGKNEKVVPGIKVKAVDTTGAGDAFNGGFATAVAEGMPVELALQFANCTGALSVTKAGTSPAMPYRKDILALMKKEYDTDIKE